MRSKYGLRFADGLVPTVEITTTEYRGRLDDDHRMVCCPVQVVVKRRRGFTRSHALTRAITWRAEHGDKRTG